MDYYTHSVDDIEQITGLDFFYQLDDNIENKIENINDFSSWR